MSEGASIELLEREVAQEAQPSTSLHTSVPAPYDKRLMVFAGRGSQELGARIANKLDIGLGQVELRTFSNGEVYCRYLESIRGADVFIVQSTHAPVNRNLMELLLMIDAAKGASAHRIIAVTPWYGYSRQDKKSAPREPISARLVARMLETAGADRVLAMHLHAAATHGVFSGPAFERLAGPEIEEIVVTDTIPLSSSAPDKIKVLSVADILARSIRSIFTDGSVSELFAGDNQLF